MENNRLFIGCYPAGLVYADRFHETNGDYTTVAFLSYATLNLEWRQLNPDRELRRQIEDSARQMQARRGHEFRIAGNATVILGSN